MKHIIKLEIVGPKQMSAFLEKKVEDIRSDLAIDIDVFYFGGILTEEAKKVSVKANFKSENEAGKHCDWCSGIIGSKDYKTFVSTGDPKEEIYFHISCYEIMKNKGIIGTKEE